MAEHEVTMGEMARRQDRFEARLDSLPETYVGRREYNIDQRNTADRLQENALATQKVDGKVEVVEKQQAEVEKERQNAAANRRWQLFILFASPVAATLVTLYFSQGQATP